MTANDDDDDDDDDDNNNNNNNNNNKHLYSTNTVKFSALYKILIKS